MENTNTQEIEGIDYVLCPYCKEKMSNITWTHLKTHGKTLQEMREEFPNIKGKCDKLIEKKRLLSSQNKENHNKLKTIQCCYCKKDMEVKNNESNTQACQECLDKGLKDPDKRKSKQAQLRREQTFSEKYGVKNSYQIQSVIDKIRKTNKEKYGGTGFASQILAQKTRKSIQEIYGQDNYMQTEEGRNASSEWSKKENNPERAKKISEALKGHESKLKGKTYEEIHGEEKAKNMLKLKKVSAQKEFLENLNIYLQEHEVEICGEYNNSHALIDFKCKKCGHIFKCSWNNIQQGFTCPKCYPRNDGTSKQEHDIYDFIKSLDSNLIVELNVNNIISPKQIDIYIPSKKIGIEYDGLYWHSEYAGKDKNYHYDKTITCEKLGIKLIHIFEDEWYYKKEIVKSKLKQILGYYNGIYIDFEECQINKIDFLSKKIFLETFHIQDDDRSLIKLGAFYNEELVSIMTFSQIKENMWELNRFCSNPKYSIPKISSKLLKYFQKNYGWKEIISYVDRRWSQGDECKELGFSFEHATQPNYWYLDNLKRINNSSIKYEEKYDRIWDCGTLKFTMTNPNQEVKEYVKPLNIEKHILTDDEKFKSIKGELVVCPYCHKTFEDQLTTTHLSTHGKTFEDIKKEFPVINFVSNNLKLKLRSNKSKTKDAICVFCGSKTMVPVELGKSRVVCEECKSKGLKVKQTKIVTCYYCKKQCEVNLRSSSNYSVCEECKSKGLRNPQAGKNAKLADKNAKN